MRADASSPAALRSDAASRELRALKEWVSLAQAAPSGSALFDVGACRGTYTTVVADASRHVYAFEPHPGRFRQLISSIAANHSPHVHAYNYAVSAERGWPLLHFSKERPQRSSLLRDVTIHTERIFVPAMPLDDFVDVPCGAIKIDVEGAEHLVLAGAQTLLTRWKPRLLIEVLPSADVKRLCSLLPNYHWRKAGACGWTPRPEPTENEYDFVAEAFA